MALELGIQTYQILTKDDEVCIPSLSKGQLNSEWIYEVIVSPKMSTKNFNDFCPGSLLKGGCLMFIWAERNILCLENLSWNCKSAKHSIASLDKVWTSMHI